MSADGDRYPDGRTPSRSSAAIARCPCSRGRRPVAETSVLVGGSLRTLDPERPRGAALVLSGERIAAVLDDPADAPAGARRVDLAGGWRLPGPGDAPPPLPRWGPA